MTVLIKQAKIICPSSSFHGKQQDILIKEGKINKIDDHIDAPDSQVIAIQGLCVSLGWMDIFADFADPGFEYRETLESGAKAAAAGGFTDVMLMPNSQPVVDNKSQVEYITQKSKQLAVNIHPIGALTKQTEGKELSEMYDMHQSGAIAFSDGIHPVQTPGLLLKALQYVVAIDATVIQVPDDHTIGSHGLINEGIISTQLGLPGKPAIAEELMIVRDIELANYTGSKIHITAVSTQKSVDLIAKAKSAGTRISCSATPYHCFFCDEDLQQYDTNLKVNPPLRTRKDMQAVQQAVLDGTIDCIATHHLPQNWDNKTCEFEYAKFGMTGLETAFAVLRSMGCSAERFVQMQTQTARDIFGLASPTIEPGAAACLSLFLPDAEFVYAVEKIKSKSKNSPFIGTKLTGSVIGIINGNHIELN